MRHAVSLALCLGLPLGLCVLAACDGPAPPPDTEPDVVGPDGIEGFRTGQSFFYVVPAGDDDVVLVDTGEETDGATLHAVTEGKHILAALLTHSHDDHLGGALQIGPRAVYAGREELPRIRGETQHQGLVQTLARSVRGESAPIVPEFLEPVDDGQKIELGTVSFTAVAMPGHTPGSTMYLLGEVLFAGDAIFGGETLAAAPSVFSDDPEEAEASLDRLGELEFSVLLDGHTGRWDEFQLP